MTDPDERALLRGIIANPDDDTARVVFADWLDERATQHQCRHHGCKSGQVYAMRQCGDGIMRNAWGDCPACCGTGTVSDDRHERAEFIRVQVELARHDEFTADAVSDPLLIRQRKLLTDDRRREWARVPWVIGTETLDRFDRRDGGQAAPHFRRGFVERVTVPGPEWLFERVDDNCPHCDGNGCRHCSGTGNVPPWRVTPWALAVASTHPVTEFVIGGHGLINSEQGVWWIAEDVAEAAKVSPGAYTTRESAEYALATAAADVVREAVREMWAK